MARMFTGGMAGNLSYYGVPALKAALGRVAGHPGVDADRIGAIGFCLGGSIVLTWACTDGRLGAIAPFCGAAPRPREAIRRLCPVVGSWPGKDFTTKAAGVLEAGLTAAGIPHDLKVYPGARHSFFNDQWRNYHAAAAADSWQRVLAFFAEHVRGQPGSSRLTGCCFESGVITVDDEDGSFLAWLAIDSAKDPEFVGKVARTCLVGSASSFRPARPGSRRYSRGSRRTRWP